MKLLYQLIKYYWFILIFSVGLGQDTGCMDNGRQPWSPNVFSPACNYDPDAKTDDGSCLYVDCAGECGGNAEEDECGVCGGNNTSCSDCSGKCVDGMFSCVGGINDGIECQADNDCPGIPYGTAYEDACGCVGGNTGKSDAFKMEMDSTFLEISSSVQNYRIPVNVSSVDSLYSFYMELDYDSTDIQIIDISKYGNTNNNNYFTLVHPDTISNNTSFNKRATVSLIYSPGTDCSQFTNNPTVCEEENNGDCFWNVDIEKCEQSQFSTGCGSTDDFFNFFKIKINSNELETGVVVDTTSISIHNLVLNENSLDTNSVWNWDIIISDPQYCDVDTACNYGEEGACEYAEEHYDCNGNCIGNECDDCDVWEGGQNDGDIDGDGYDCEISCPDGEERDCNEDCCDLSVEGDCAYIDSNCGEDFCAGGNTGNNCIQDCSGVWNGSAYKDFCGNCIAGSDDIDCFRYSFNVYNSNGYIIENDIVPELDTFYISLYMYPEDTLEGIDLEGIDVKLGFDTNILSLDDWSLSPNDDNFDIEGDLTSELLANSDYILEGSKDSDTTFSALIYGTSNELYQGDSANILFLQFSSSGTDGDSTLINYNEITINETHIMKEQNYTPKMIYFGDCFGVINGDAQWDECWVCDGDGPEEGLDCNGEPLSINESLIPQNFILSQNYPNPFNPITYIQYSVPNFDFITIDIINISGQIIKTIVQSSHHPGNYEIMWDGTNYYGISVPSGIYFYKMDADEFVSVKKLVLLK